MISPADERPDFLKRLRSLGDQGTIKFDDTVYRLVNSQYSKGEDVVSGAVGTMRRVAGIWRANSP